MIVAGAVLAGGAGRRMGGVDKAMLAVGGVTLLERVIAAARPVCASLVVVGPPRPLDVRFVQEPEPGGGPVPAVQAALGALPPSEVVLVLAADLPLVTTAHLERLLAALGGAAAGAAAAQGPNPLLAAYRRDALAERAAALGPGDRAAGLLPPAVVTVDLGDATLNVNRPEDLEGAERLLAESAPPPGDGQ